MRAWIKRRDGCDEPTATERACEVWPHTITSSVTFTEALRSGAAST